MGDVQGFRAGLHASLGKWRHPAHTSRLNASERGIQSVSAGGALRGETGGIVESDSAHWCEKKGLQRWIDGSSCHKAAKNSLRKSRSANERVLLGAFSELEELAVSPSVEPSAASADQRCGAF